MTKLKKTNKQRNNKWKITSQSNNRKENPQVPKTKRELGVRALDRSWAEWWPGGAEVCESTAHWGLLIQEGAPGTWPHTSWEWEGGHLHQVRVTESCTIHEPGTRKLYLLSRGRAKESCHPSRVIGKKRVTSKTNKPNNMPGVKIHGISKLKKFTWQLVWNYWKIKESHTVAHATVLWGSTFTTQGMCNNTENTY